jgi:outer membrane protein TolC
MCRLARALLDAVFATIWLASVNCSAQTAPPLAGGQTPPAGGFNDRVPGGPPIVSEETLEDAWRIALAGDQRVEAGDFNLSAADHACAAARAERFPTVNLGANCLALSGQPAFSVDLPPLPSTQLPFMNRDSLGFHAVVSQPIYTFGRISSGISAADAEVHANQAESARIKLEVKMRVAELYIAVLRGIQVVDVNRSRVASLTAHAGDVENRFKKGMASRNDLLAVQVALADAQQQAVQARNVLEMLCAAYNRALRRGLTNPVHLVELQGNGDPGNVDELTKMACAGRPEIAGLSAQARALRAQAEATQAKNAPQIAVSGGFLYQADKYVDPNGIAGVALTAEWNAFDSGRNKEQALALFQKSEAVLRMRNDAESMIALEVRQKRLEVQTARDQLELARKATAQADENLRVVRNRYLQGLAINTEVLDAETLRAQAYMNLYNSYYESILAGLRVRRAVGNL